MNKEEKIVLADSENKTLYYTPTVEELLIAIIYNKDIYTNDECELRFTYEESVENKLMKFLQMNDKIGDDYFINNQLYKLKLVKDLDAFDIESLGFDKEFLCINEFGGIQDRYFRLTLNCGVVGQDIINYRLRHYPNKNTINIEMSTEHPSPIFIGEVLFNGIIKNKSELKRLLKQLNIQ